MPLNAATKRGANEQLHTMKQQEAKKKAQFLYHEISFRFSLPLAYILCKNRKKHSQIFFHFISYIIRISA